MALPSIYLNGMDMDSLGFHVETISGPWDMAEVTVPSIAIPGRRGEALAGGQVSVKPTDIVIGGKVYAQSGPRTNVGLEAMIDTIKLLVSYGALELRRANQPGRIYATQLVSARVSPIGPALAATAADVSLTLRSLDPLAYDASPLCVSAPAVANASPVPLGTGPSSGILRIFGPATNPVVTYRDIGGVALHTIGFTRALLSTDYEEIDLDLLKVTRYQSGVASNDVAAVTSGDLESFLLSPLDGEYSTATWPTIECSGLTGSGSIELTYFRSWL